MTDTTLLPATGALTITIPLNVYTDLKRDSLFLSALEAAGVDNWDGYDYAWEIMREIQSEPEYDDA